MKSVDPNMKVDATYAGTFSDPAKGQTIAKAKMAQGEHIIFQAAGGVGNGVFQAAKDQDATLAADSKDKVWVIGVDMDQTNMGDYKSKDGKSANLTLTSSLTGVGRGVQLITESAQKDKFPGGEHLVYGLDDKGVAVTRGHMSAATWDAVQAAKKQIIDGKVEVPAK